MAAPGSAPDPDAARRSSDEAVDGRSEGPEYLVVGHITRPHGVKGELYVDPLTDEPDEVFAPEREVLLGDGDGELEPDAPELVVERVRPFKRGLLVKFEGFEDRTAVEPFAQRYLLVAREHLRPLEEGEVYYHQLLGLQVETVGGDVVGRVREVYDTEPAELLDVKGAGRSHLIPFVERVVKEVDVEGGRIVIEPPPGLLEL